MMFIDCPDCNADGFLSFGDRHVENRKEVCPTCKGQRQILAATGERRETSFNPSVVQVDPVVEAVRLDLLLRSQVGLAKYGTPLSRTDLHLRDWLQHAYEEALDMANYLKRTIMELDNAPKD